MKQPWAFILSSSWWRIMREVRGNPVVSSSTKTLEWREPTEGTKAIQMWCLKASLILHMIGYWENSGITPNLFNHVLGEVFIQNFLLLFSEHTHYAFSHHQEQTPPSVGQMLDSHPPNPGWFGWPRYQVQIPPRHQQGRARLLLFELQPDHYWQKITFHLLTGIFPE